MRAFIALPIDSITTDILNKKVALLKRQAWSHQIKWFEPSNYHLTIRFLGGKLENDKVNEILHLIDKCFIAEPISSFSIQITAIELFPSPLSAHTIVASAQSNDLLIHIEKLLERKLETIGLVKPQLTFRPHISLGRIDRQTNLNNLTIPNEVAHFENCWLNVNSICLYQSELTENAPIYTPLKTIHLRPLKK
ncbi:RNA 2',3'-cyclic phosphodiesterase [Thiomicrorhabdus immobilis]|uniref:RNA 2',3'-cyclic phosphodiesterase n=1 Tax=Thiomicrorhabdus immobilis TaxID=2791037 RepID=A0ABN6CW44_9GAMM|nr:RNA 2',3'-cyclic phosphodiesterase [Thiomicrorhabdus immobilis]BCN93278.1 RNA 2',3'-cyclic phosphodiesterase [Thiomicrorhabdus immobilis]